MSGDDKSSAHPCRGTPRGIELPHHHMGNGLYLPSSLNGRSGFQLPQGCRAGIYARTAVGRRYCSGLERIARFVGESLPFIATDNPVGKSYTPLEGWSAWEPAEQSDAIARRRAVGAEISGTCPIFPGLRDYDGRVA